VTTKPSAPARDNRAVTVSSGLVILGDVSGYTEFIATTELEHSREILAELLGAVCEAAQGNLRIAQIEGDAVFWLCEEPAPELVDSLKTKFIEFHRRVRFMTLATTCSCRACVSVGDLTLKFIVHHGSYVRQTVAGSDHFVGSDLVLAHRLLKNTVPSREYVLITESALAKVRADGAVAHEEVVDHLGTIPCAYIELSGLRARALAERTEHLEPPEAQLRCERTFPATLERVRLAIRDTSLRGADEHLAVYDDPLDLEDEGASSGATHPVSLRGARGTVTGQEAHCHHRADGKRGNLLRIIRSERSPGGSRTTTHVIGPGEVEGFYVTQILSETPTGVHLDLRYAWEPLGDPTVSPPEGLPEMVNAQLDRVAALMGRQLPEDLREPASAGEGGFEPPIT
jgi:hypothetical protein